MPGDCESNQGESGVPAMATTLLKVHGPDQTEILLEERLEFHASWIAFCILRSFSYLRCKHVEKKYDVKTVCACPAIEISDNRIIFLWQACHRLHPSKRAYRRYCFLVELLG